MHVAAATTIKPSLLTSATRRMDPPIL